MTANILTELCLTSPCDLVVSNEETRGYVSHMSHRINNQLHLFSFARVANLTVEPMNIAIPLSLIGENEEGQLMFTFYVQFPDGFISKELLELALQVCRCINYCFQLSFLNVPAGR